MSQEESVTRSTLASPRQLYKRVDEETKLLVCAAYGDLDGINSFSGRDNFKQDVNALMVAEANGQSAAARLIKEKFPALLSKKTRHRWIWKKAYHANDARIVYLPVSEFTRIV
eukprot:TRINITY_DN7509_c0_g1_i6.p1 TRINITY_DN7509_c0_g1~~TRINITY_DN7509_c0_g1_i6.p1  ORF type:complete len:113 (+),score=31.11 TRINITY_DN7509_c0_g1_i6:48-386(+)